MEDKLQIIRNKFKTIRAQPGKPMINSISPGQLLYAVQLCY